MGVAPILGRLFTEADEKAGRGDLIVLGERLWRNHFGARADIVGQTIRLDNEPFTVTGVLPQSFTFPRGYEISTDLRPMEHPNFWRPLLLSPSDRTNYGNHNTSAIARLKPGVTVGTAQAELAAMSAAVYRSVAPAAAGEFGVAVVGYHDNLVRNTRASLLLLGAAVFLVLLTACANVAGLLLVQAAARQREMALRASLGAAPARLIRQVFVESLLLSLAGCLAGTVLSFWGIQALRGLAGARFARLDTVSVDAASLAFSLAAAALTALLFGLAPAFFAARLNLSDQLRDGARAGSGTAHHRFRAVLVVGQVALSMTLLSAAGLLARSFYSVLQANRGFQVSRVLTMRIPLPRYNYPTAEAQRAFFDRLLTQVSALPGIESAGIINQLPLTGEGNIHAVTIEGKPAQPGEEPVAEDRYVTPGYFQTLRLPLRAGRWLGASDHGAAPRVAVINETMARRFWPGESPIGKRFRLGSRAWIPWVEVVGVIADSRQASLEKAITPQIFSPFAQAPTGDMCLAVRTGSAPERAVPAIRDVIRSIDAGQPVTQVRTLEEVLAESVSSRRLQTFVLGAFSVFALLLAAAGLYGLVAWSVAQRTREFGIRAALGARRGQVLGLVFSQGARLSLLGAALGLAAALALGRFLEGFLYGVEPGDAFTLAGVAFVLLASAGLATLVPAWRASRVEPTVALREG
jgi:putative ABC transport system permease protein